MTNQEANLELAYELLNLIDTYPNMRFSEILQTFGFIKPERAVKDPNRIGWQNEFNVESEKLLERVKRRIKDMEET